VLSTFAFDKGKQLEPAHHKSFRQGSFILCTLLAATEQRPLSCTLGLKLVTDT
jgi:hypothetical protein